MAETDYGKLSRTIGKHADFLATMKEAAKELGLSDPTEAIGRVARLKPEQLVVQADSFGDVSRFYVELAKSARHQIEDLDDIWTGDTAEEFGELFGELANYVSGDDISLSTLAASTGTQLKDTASALLGWQNSLADLIAESSNAYDDAWGNAWSEFADIFSTDPVGTVAQILQGLIWGCSELEKGYVTDPTLESSEIGSDSTVSPMNNSSLSVLHFKRELGEIPAEI